MTLNIIRLVGRSVQWCWVQGRQSHILNLPIISPIYIIFSCSFHPNYLWISQHSQASSPAPVLRHIVQMQATKIAALWRATYPVHFALFLEQVSHAHKESSAYIIHNEGPNVSVCLLTKLLPSLCGAQLAAAPGLPPSVWRFLLNGAVNKISRNFHMFVEVTPPCSRHPSTSTLKILKTIPMLNRCLNKVRPPKIGMLVQKSQSWMSRLVSKGV